MAESPEAGGPPGGPPVCPECEGPLVRGTFCRACGYDAELEGPDGDGYLDGVELPTDENPDEDRDAVPGARARDDLGAGPGAPARWGLLLVALALLAWLVAAALAGRS